MKNSNNKVCVTSEYVVLSEDITTYKWILLMQAQMVPAFSINDIRLIFVCEAATLSLLQKKSIGTYYHENLNTTQLQSPMHKVFLRQSICSNIFLYTLA